MPLYFQIKIVKCLLAPQGSLFCLLEASAEDKLGNLATDTAGKSNKALMILLQKFFIYPRPVVETLKVSFGSEVNEILVSSLIFGEENEVVMVFISGTATEATALSDINLTADNRFYPGLSGCLVELNHAVHHTVVGYSQAVHTQLSGS